MENNNARGIKPMNGLAMKYFVLKPSGDDVYAQASRNAMRVYAKHIQVENVELSHDIDS